MQSGRFICIPCAERDTRSLFKFLKRIGPKKLLSRMVMIVVIPMLLVQTITGTLFFTQHYETVSRRMAQSVISEVILSLRLIEQFPERSSEITKEIEKAFGIKIRFFKNKGVKIKRKTAWLNPVEITELEKLLEENLKEPYSLEKSSDKKVFILRIDKEGEGMEIHIPKKRIFSHTFYIVLGWMVLSGIILLALAAVFTKNQVRAVEYLSWAAQRFGRGEKDVFFKPTGATEVRKAGIALIEMNSRLTKQASERTAMLSGISHDLRTPLTRMRLSLSLLKPRTKEIDAVEEDVKEMEKMVTAYLDFAKGEGKEKARQADLNKLLKDILKNHPKVKSDIRGGAKITIRPEEIKRLLHNIIGNAERYGKNVWFQSVVRSREVAFVIDDDGPGIPKNKRETVFKPFIRLEESRNVKTGGIGLGMTIAKDIAMGHGGRILLSDSPRGGLRVSIHLPL